VHISAPMSNKSNGSIGQQSKMDEEGNSSFTVEHEVASKPWGRVHRIRRHKDGALFVLKVRHCSS
jgi:hypothetical protein